MSCRVTPAVRSMENAGVAVIDRRERIQGVFTQGFNTPDPHRASMLLGELRTLQH